ncbi:MBL fold metallo-hydrolase [Pseudonocardia sp.]|uniref:MBL fold metallo-hydrolase n=3 Tax=Pseudonocardia sp. TaxID=60912 RepID=UPI003D136322
MTSPLSIGRYRLLPVKDGAFRMPRNFLGDGREHPELLSDDGKVWLPIGAFLMPGDEPLLIDAGLAHGFPKPEIMTGGALLDELATLGTRPEDVRHLALSHLHPDHVGWVATKRGGVTFPNAQVYIAQGDWDHFIDAANYGPPPWVRQALCDLAERGRVTIIEGERQIVPGLTALPAPGHTPGHTVFVVHDGRERAMLLGDAIYCPQQLTAVDWSAATDVDPVLARQTREWLWREIDSSGAAAVGPHFPGLQAGRVLGRRWQAVPHA